MTSPLVHLVRRPRKAVPRPPLLVLLHGVGSNEGDLFGLEETFGPEFTVVSVRAPLGLRPGSYAWFPVQFTPQGPVIDPVAAESSRAALGGFVDWAVAEYSTDPARTVLAGFSQGAIMAVSLALTEPEKVSAAVLMSGRILPEVVPYAAEENRRTRPRYLIVHGTEDDRLPVHHGRESQQTLIDLGIEPDYREFTMGHTVTDESLAFVGGWVNGLFR